MRRLNEIILHASATRPNWMEGASLWEQVEEIRRWHMEDRGWSDIGYHFVVGRWGHVVLGRPLERPGAHVRGRNSTTIGVCLLGGHGGSADDDFFDNFTRGQHQGLFTLLRSLTRQYGISRISGHNEYANKACPCFRVTEEFLSPLGVTK